MKFKVGDKVKLTVNDSYPDYRKHYGETGVIFEVASNEYNNFDWRIRWENGDISSIAESNLISSSESIKEKTIKMKLNTMMKKVLDKDIRLLIKAELINGDLEFTEKGKEALNAILFEANKKELVEIAQEIIEEAKEEKKGC